MPNNPTEIISKFYTAFQQKDFQTMNALYSQDAVFSDPVFKMLDSTETKYMWEMLCKRAKEFSLTFNNIEAVDDEYVHAQWQATYIFTKTGRKVTNNIKAYMRIKDGLIVEHTDSFSLSAWARQALGAPGFLLGWTDWMQNKIHKEAKSNLAKFMKSSSI